MFDNYPPGASSTNNPAGQSPVVDMYAGLSQQAPLANSQQLPPQANGQNQPPSMMPMDLAESGFGGGLKFLVIGLVTLVVVLVAAVVAYQLILKPKFSSVEPVNETPLAVEQEAMLEETPIVSSTDGIDTQIVYSDASSTTSSVAVDVDNPRQATSSQAQESMPAAEQDSDGDGLIDDLELLKGTDKLKADTDGDGLTDSQEINQYQTDPLKADTDGDGLSDGEEVNKYQTKPLQADTDADGFSDGQEVKNNYNPLGPGRLVEAKR